jgi:hypothetical protein
MVTRLLTIIRVDGRNSIAENMPGPGSSTDMLGAGSSTEKLNAAARGDLESPGNSRRIRPLCKMITLLDLICH